LREANYFYQKKNSFFVVWYFKNFSTTIFS